jgi:hypothetical protein
VGVGLDFVGINPVKALYWTAVINGLLAPFLARGRRASAAWRVVSICVMPWRFRVIAVVRMMKNMTMFEKNAPTPTSKFLSSSSLSVAPLR